MNTKLEQMIESLSVDTQAVPDRNQLLGGLRDVLEKMQTMRKLARIDAEIASVRRTIIDHKQGHIDLLEQELSAQKAKLAHMEETVRIQGTVIKSLTARDEQGGAL